MKVLKAGVDVFRIFDSLNWVDRMKVANEAVQKAGKISEGTICYRGYFKLRTFKCVHFRLLC